MFLRLFAKWFARIAHGLINQRRKYTGERYSVHTDAIGDAAKPYGPRVQAAGYLHDWIEDVVPALISQGRWFTLAVLRFFYGFFPADVQWSVAELTHEYTHEKYPDKKRAWRKHQEAVRLSLASLNSRILKVLDMTDNTRTIVQHDAEFAKVYLAEKKELLDLIAHGVPQHLLDAAYAQV